LSGGGPAGVPAARSSSPWVMTGSETGDRLIAGAAAGETADGRGAFGIDLWLGRGAVMLHDQDGFIDFGVGGSSYYYSRPRDPVVRGVVTLDGKRVPVTGEAWF